MQRALESWQPKFVEWWKRLGPVAFQDHDVYLRTAVSVSQDGWANFDYVRMPEYRWGIFLADAEPDRARSRSVTISATPVWQEVPGEYRAELRRLARRAGRHRAGFGRAATAALHYRPEPL